MSKKSVIVRLLSKYRLTCDSGIHDPVSNMRMIILNVLFCSNHVISFMTILILNKLYCVGMGICIWKRRDIATATTCRRMVQIPGLNFPELQTCKGINIVTRASAGIEDFGFGCLWIEDWGDVAGWKMS